MKLYFVRHGQTDWNAAGRIQGHADVPLNNTGLAQAESLRDEITSRALKFDAVYSSPLQRVHRTAEIISDGKYNIIVDIRLSEREVGEFEGKPSGALFNSAIDFLDPELNAGDFGVEPINDFVARVASFLEDLPKSYPSDAKILIVTSNGVMKRAYPLLTGRPAPDFANTELIEFEI